MDEKSLLTWFEQINGRVSEVIYPTRPENHSAWTDLFTEMQTALESVFPPSHTVLREWEEAMSCESQAVQISPELHDRDLILQLQDDLLEISELLTAF
jgi:hypothetical protein